MFQRKPITTSNSTLLRLWNLHSFEQRRPVIFSTLSLHDQRSQWHAAFSRNSSLSGNAQMIRVVLFLDVAVTGCCRHGRSSMTEIKMAAPPAALEHEESQAPPQSRFYYRVVGKRIFGLIFCLLDFLLRHLSPINPLCAQPNPIVCAKVPIPPVLLRPNNLG
jgi:hypothetical protein